MATLSSALEPHNWRIEEEFARSRFLLHQHETGAKG